MEDEQGIEDYEHFDAPEEIAAEHDEQAARLHEPGGQNREAGGAQNAAAQREQDHPVRPAAEVGPYQRQMVGPERRTTRGQPFRQRAADMVLNHRGLRHLLPKSTQQHVNPLAMRPHGGRQWLQPIDIRRAGMDEPVRTYEITRATPRNLTASIRTGDEFLSQTIHVSSSCVFRTGHMAPEIEEQVRLRFPVYTERNSARVWAIEVPITQLAPDDVAAPWFSMLADMLARTRIGLSASRNHARAIDTTFLHRNAQVSALTAAVLVMKNHGSFEGIARAFSYDPRKVAADIRQFRLGRVLGTQATRYLLGCIMAELGRDDYYSHPTELISAGQDLIVAHLNRDDHHQFLRRAEGTESHLIGHKLADLLNLPYDRVPNNNLKRFFRMEAVRQGMLYGAMRRYAYDLDLHNHSHVDILQLFSRSASRLAGAVTAALPLGRQIGAGIDVAGTGLDLAVNDTIGKRWVRGFLDRAILGHFKIHVIAAAGLGRLARQVQVDATMEQLKALLAEEFVPIVTALVEESLASSDNHRASLLPVKGSHTGKQRG